MPSGATLTSMWIGICCCHSSPRCIPMGGYILTGSSNLFTGSLTAGRLTDLTIGWCGHPGFIITGAPTAFGNSLSRARIGSSVNGCNIGTIITGHPTKFIGNSGGAAAAPLTITINFQGQNVTYTEVDFGNNDDEVSVDDGLNIYPPVEGRPPTAEEIARSNELDVSPTTTVADSTSAAIDTTTAPTSCLTAPEPAPASFQLSTNYTLGDLSVDTVLSKYTVRAQAGFTYQDMICNLQALADHIGEPLSTQFGRANMIITSGFRPGSGTSQHERGQAFDIQYPLYTNTQVFNIAEYIRDNLPFDQLILEYGGNRPWIHCSYNRAGNRSVTAGNKFGTRVSPGNYVWGVLKNMA